MWSGLQVDDMYQFQIMAEDPFISNGKDHAENEQAVYENPAAIQSGVSPGTRRNI
jgi:hypothetical protein